MIDKPILITGDQGAGKTSLAKQLIPQIHHRWIIVNNLIGIEDVKKAKSKEIAILVDGASFDDISFISEFDSSLFIMTTNLHASKLPAKILNKFIHINLNNI